MHSPLTVQTRLDIIHENVQHVRHEQYRAEVSLRVQRKIGEKEQIAHLTTVLEKYEQMLDELDAIRAEVAAEQTL